MGLRFGWGPAAAAAGEAGGFVSLYRPQRGRRLPATAAIPHSAALGCGPARASLPAVPARPGRRRAAGPDSIFFPLSPPPRHRR